ncbi:MAG TPA: MFS transporter, partial [Methanocorpusculum sp.]|nr:MFS transporter [Methanocorpusculum sp.]
GAFLMVFPAGMLSDRFGGTPLVRIGLFGTLVSAVVLWISYPDPAAAVALRFAEGLFTGMFVSAAMAFVNSAADHRRLAGGFVALMNVGMVAGLVVSGWLASVQAYAGVLVFGILTGAAGLLSLGLADDAPAQENVLPFAAVKDIAVYHKWLWAALFVSCGTTGVVISAYPELSGASADVNGVVTALMSVATAVFVYAASRMRTADSLSVVQVAGLLLAVSVPVVLVNPVGMIFVGAVFGVITAAVLNYLAETKKPQGVMNGMFNMTQYAGMAALPFAAGLLVLPAGYAVVFLIVAVLNATAGLLVVRCPCYVR